jgi:hypothetical protein
MHRLKLDEAKAVYLSSLTDGTVFIANFGNGHGHQSGLVFGEEAVLILSGPERFSAFQFRKHDKTAVVPCPEWADMVVSIPTGHAIERRETPRLGRLVVDDNGVHLTCRWRDEEDALPDFFAVRLGAWDVGNVPSGVEVDAWALARLDERENVIELVGFSGQA